MDHRHDHHVHRRPPRALLRHRGAGHLGPRLSAVSHHPCRHPDGYSYTWTNNRLWRKNRRPNPNGSTGVDLNRNWGYQWGGEGASTSQGSDTYRGASGFSEPETQAIRDFITNRPYIRAHVDVHSYSQLILSPWGYTPALRPTRCSSMTSMR